MMSFITFFKKEILEQIRTKRLMIVGMLFVFFGIMNPLTAKITPALLELFADSMENSGIIIEGVEITALDSWMQFFKNFPTLLIAFILLESSLFSKEYQNGTLTLVLTKGFERYKIVLSKFLVISLIWTIGYILYTVITYGYTVYYWDNSVVKNLLFSILICWIFGLFVVSLFTLITVNIESTGGTLALTGGIIFALYMISLIPKFSKYLPTLLIDGNSLVYGLKECSYYIPSVIITILLIVMMLLGSIFTFNKKKI